MRIRKFSGSALTLSFQIVCAKYVALAPTDAEKAAKSPPERPAQPAPGPAGAEPAK